MKSIYAAWVAALLVVLACMWALHRSAEDVPGWVCFLPCIVLLYPVSMQLKRSMVTLRIHDGHLTLETGFLSRTRRTLDMAKIQDVTVQQTFPQRLMGVGDIMLESAGESGTMGIQNLDSPREVADAIIAGSRGSVRRSL